MEKITKLFRGADSLEPAEKNAAWEEVLRELRKTALGLLKLEAPGISVSIDDLVNSAYLRLFGKHQPVINDRKHLYRMANRTMRRILIDRKRKHSAAKRSAVMVPLDEGRGKPLMFDEDALAIDLALEHFRSIEPVAAEVFEQKHYYGRSIPEVATELDLSDERAQALWELSKAFLNREIKGTSKHAAAAGKKA